MATLKKLPQSAPNKSAVIRTNQTGRSVANRVSSPSTGSVYLLLGARQHERMPCPCYRRPELTRSVRMWNPMSEQNPREELLEARRVVVKIGTKSITAGDAGRFGGLDRT